MNGHHLSTKASVAFPVAPGVHQHTTEVSQQETQGMHFPLEHPACWPSLHVPPGRQAPSSTLLSSRSLCALRQGFQLVVEHSTPMVLDTGPAAALWSTVFSGCPVVGLYRVEHVTLNHALPLPVFYRRCYTGRSSTKLGHRSVLLCVGSPSLSSLGLGQFAKSDS